MFRHITRSGNLGCQISQKGVRIAMRAVNATIAYNHLFGQDRDSLFLFKGVGGGFIKEVRCVFVLVASLVRGVEDRCYHTRGFRNWIGWKKEEKREGGVLKKSIEKDLKLEKVLKHEYILYSYAVASTFMGFEDGRSR